MEPGAGDKEGPESQGLRRCLPLATLVLRYLVGELAAGRLPPSVVHRAPNPFMLAQAQGRQPVCEDFVASLFSFAVLDIEQLFRDRLAGIGAIGGLPCINPDCGGINTVSLLVCYL